MGNKIWETIAVVVHMFSPSLACLGSSILAPPVVKVEFDVMGRLHPLNPVSGRPEILMEVWQFAL